MAGALVYLSGTSFSAETDSGGRFLMNRLPEGRYTAALIHPRLDSLGTISPAFPVRITEGEASEAYLELPSGSTVLADACKGEALAEGTSALLGTARDAITGTPMAGVTIRVTWSSFQAPGGLQTLREVQEGAEYQTDSEGRYVACGVPVDQTLSVSAAFMNRETQTLQIQARAGRPTVADFSLKYRSPRRP